MRIDGILLIDKPEGWRSRQVVDAIGKRFRIRKIGHAGTLDPIATGLLILLLGEGTKLSPFLMAGRKHYRATIRLGVETDTYDREGEVVAEHPLDELTPEQVRAALARFRGTIEQVPPRFAAIKVGGRPAYRYAREGSEVAVAPRTVTIHSLQVLRLELPEVEIEVLCSKGTYLRSLAHDLGEVLGVGGHLVQIRRLGSEPYAVDQAHDLEELLEAEPERFREAVIPLTAALPHLPRIEVDGEDPLAERVATGGLLEGDLLEGRLPTEVARGDLVQIVTPEHLAIAEVVMAPGELGPPPWIGTQPLRYRRVLRLRAPERR